MSKDLMRKKTFKELYNYEITKDNFVRIVPPDNDDVIILNKREALELRDLLDQFLLSPPPLTK